MPWHCEPGLLRRLRDRGCHPGAAGWQPPLGFACSWATLVPRGSEKLLSSSPGPEKDVMKAARGFDLPLNSAACSSAVRKPAISLADSTDLRVLLNIMYLIVETVRQEAEGDKVEWKTMRQTFRAELGAPLYNNEPFSVMLFGMVTKFCSGHAPHFPMKKVLLLLWKTVLCTLGGFEELQSMKAEKREILGLPPLPEDSIKVIRNMRAASPPASASDLIEQQQKRGRREHKALIKQDNLDAFNERDPYKADDSREEEEENDDDNSLEGETFPLERDEVMPPPTQHPPSDRIACPKGLPWAPKVREKDIEMFLESSRSKFIGYTLGSDTNTVVGLPRPIHESIRTLKQHKYTSIAEVQVHMEDEYLRSPLSGGEEEVEQVPAEILYQGLLPSLPQYMIALLKILLAAAPTSKAKTDSINILADVLPEEMPTTVLQSMKLGVDVNRHKEIIVKAISAVLLLLLKHFKLNHIYQFEYMAQHLVFANCIPLILKFFNQNIMSYITAKNSISVLDYPYCVVHELPELTAESLEAGDNNQFCWRNLFSCINLLRILNKLTKWKHSRTMMLVVFKSAPILKRALKVKQAMMQLYVLKLLKVQTKYLGRQWRKSNMKTMSAIYQKVRHRLNDDWAYGNAGAEEGERPVARGAGRIGVRVLLVLLRDTGSRHVPQRLAESGWPDPKPRRNTASGAKELWKLGTGTFPSAWRRAAGRIPSHGEIPPAEPRSCGNSAPARD
nr:PREDICTED: striatin-interacting protein 1-like [Apteryx mantelli mantelli]